MEPEDRPAPASPSTAGSTPPATPAEGDDWEHHWEEYGDVAGDNPAQVYRQQLIMRAIAGRTGAASPTRILDIGSGQGDLVAALRLAHPQAELVGIDTSREGIRQAAAKVPTGRFVHQDLLDADRPLGGLDGWAEVAVCSEVLEHLDEPERFLRSAARLLTPDGVLVVTVPGGPRTAFDRHIGHRRHFRTTSLEALIRHAGLQVDQLHAAGFPFFNLYKSVVLLQGDRLADKVAKSAEPSRLAALAMRAFGLVLRPGRNVDRWGWQLVAVARPSPARRPADP